MRRSPASSTNRSLAAFGKLQHIRRERHSPVITGCVTRLNVTIPSRALCLASARIVTGPL